MPFGVTVIWPNFGAGPNAKITVSSHLHFQSFSLKLQANLIGEWLGTFDMPFGVRVL